MRKIGKIIVHCSGTSAKADIGAREIRQYHVEVLHWSDIGYHWVIRRDGRVERGRAEETVGAHVKGHNADSIGVCLVGGLSVAGAEEVNYTRAQYDALIRLLLELHGRYRDATLHSHNEFANKFCPGFSAPGWWYGRFGLEWPDTGDVD